MSSDPQAVRDAVQRAQDAFELRGRGRPTFEPGLSTDDDWETQLTKGCRLLEVADVLFEQGAYYTAIIEVSFGAIERSIEAYLLYATGNALQDFQDHEYCYNRAHHAGFVEQDTAADLEGLYGDNRTESYYGGRKPTEEQALAMSELAIAVHAHAVGLVQDGGVCRC